MDSVGFKFQNDVGDVDVDNLINNLNDNSSNEAHVWPEFGMYPLYDPFSSPVVDGVQNNDQLLNVDDLNNVNKSGLLFPNSDSFVNIPDESDLLNTLSDSIDFYNESLYNDRNKESSKVDCNVNLPNWTLYSNLDQPENNVPMEATDQGIVLNAENLENIVPKDDSNCNVSSVDYNFSDFLLLPEHKTDNNLLTSKNFKNEQPLKSGKTAAIGFASNEFNGSNFVLNKNISSVVFNKSPNKYKNKPKTIILKNPKVVSSQVLNLLTNEANFQVPVKLLKNAKGLQTANLCINKSELNKLKSRSFGFIKKRCTKPTVSRDDATKPKIYTTVNSDKAVQTIIEDDCHSCQLCMTSNTLNEEIKKPELFNNSYIFKFCAPISKFTNSTKKEFYKNDDQIHYYTGIPKLSYFVALLNCLDIPYNHLISGSDMLLLTLMKIRLNLDWPDLAYRFRKSVPVVREVFGFTVFLLLHCLSHLIDWPILDWSQRSNNTRIRTCLYFFGIKLNLNNCSHSEMNRRLFMCLSSAKHPVHFVSDPVTEDECKNKIQMLVASGVSDSLVLSDIIVFDDEIDSPSPVGDRTALLVISRNGKSFSTKPYNDYLPQIENMKEIVNEIKRYKFIFEQIKCCWVNEPKEEFVLFNDVVKVVCCLVNLCHVLPFCTVTVRHIREARKAMKIVLT